MARHPPLSPAVSYLDPKAAYRWLEEAFGFEPEMVITDADGNLVHSQMRFGEGLIMVGTEWSEEIASPRSTGGRCTQTVHVHLESGIDAHCERARKAGAVIVQEPTDQFYGDRSYRAKDPEGHLWTFGMTVQEMQPDEWDAAMPGIKTTTRLPE